MLFGQEVSSYLLLGLGFFLVFFTCFAAVKTAAVLAAAFEIKAPVQIGQGILYLYQRNSVAQFFEDWIVFVINLIIYLFDSTTREGLETVDTWIVCDVNNGIIDGDTPLRCIGDGINLCMNRGLFMTPTYDRPMVCTSEESVVPHTYESIVLH